MSVSGLSAKPDFAASDPCALCGAKSGVARDHDGYACLVCGAPRVPVATAIERPRAEKPLLERAKRSRLQRAGWGVAASLSMALGGAVLALGAVAALLFDFGTTAQAAYGALVITPLFVSALGFFRSRRAGRDARTAVEAAEAVVAGELIAVKGSLEATELAQLLGVPVERAEHLIATTQVDRMLAEGDRLRVEDAGPAPEAEAGALPEAARRQHRE
jgi:hypothetical protein